jgi:hypothetical protein
MKFILGAAVMALSVGLAACGGSGGPKRPSCGPASRDGRACPSPFPQPPSVSNVGTSLSASGKATLGTVTVPVEVNEGWHISWGYSNCSEGGPGFFHVEVYNEGVDTPGVPDPNASGPELLGAGGIGTQSYANDAGHKYFRVTSDCDWSISVSSN